MICEQTNAVSVLVTFKRILGESDDAKRAVQEMAVLDVFEPFGELLLLGRVLLLLPRDSRRLFAFPLVVGDDDDDDDFESSRSFTASSSSSSSCSSSLDDEDVSSSSLEEMENGDSSSEESEVISSFLIIFDGIMAGFGCAFNGGR
ncbi:hypothetical protein BLOT_016084 [Blomia tropicalis]|nr:hypothetical protein BLOT_016084 [Blomia tropicalis]